MWKTLAHWVVHQVQTSSQAVPFHPHNNHTGWQGRGLFLCPLDPHVLYPITQSPFHTPTPEENSQRPLINHRVGFEPGSLEFKTAVLCCCPELGKAGVLRQHSMAGVCVGGDEGERLFL